jgi:outer membrane protein assembly factor BamB
MAQEHPSDNGATNIQWGMSASPLVADGMVVVLPGGSGGKSVAAYDLQSGAPRWTALDDKAAYTAPILATLNGQRQLIIVSASRVLGLSLDGKSVLWQHPWVTDYDVNSALPVVVAPDRLLLTAGYGHGSALLQITPTGAKELWQSKSMKAKFNNVVEHEGVIYGLDEGILAAMDLKTGERKWKGGRYGYGQLLFASGHLVILTEQGEVVLVKADPTKHQEIARFTAIEGKTWNVPALAQGKLLVRNQTEMACYQIAP